MGATISYFFSMVSPWAFIGHDAFMEMAGRHSLSIAYRPVDLLKVFAETGGVPLAKRHPARLAYRRIELQRWRERRGLRFAIEPKHFPFDASLADRIVIALVESSHNPAPFMALGFQAVWQEERDLADEAVLAELLDHAGLKGRAMMERAKEAAIGELYDRNTREAIDSGYFGSPCYVRDGEPFWGQDRLELLEDAIRTDRPPFTATTR